MKIKSHRKPILYLYALLNPILSRMTCRWISRRLNYTERIVVGTLLTEIKYGLWYRMNNKQLVCSFA